MAGRIQKIEARFKTVFNSPDGKLVLKEILDHCGHGRELWAKEQIAQNANLIRHDVGTWIINKTKGQI